MDAILGSERALAERTEAQRLAWEPDKIKVKTSVAVNEALKEPEKRDKLMLLGPSATQPCL